MFFSFNVFFVRTGTLFGIGEEEKSEKVAQTEGIQRTEYPVAGYSVFTEFGEFGCEGIGKKSVRSVIDRTTATSLSSSSSSFCRTSGEFTPSANQKEGRSLDELYVTGMAAANGKLYAVSKNFNVIVEIDPVAESVIKTFALLADL